MGRTRIDSAAGLRTRLEAGATLEGVVFQGIDLVPFEAKLLQRNLRGSVFLGCRCTTDFAPAFARYGCLVVPRPEGLPYDPFRSKLYSPEELLRRFRPTQPASYHSTPDRLTHLSCMDPETGRPLDSAVEETILRRLHDDSIREALDEFLGAQLVRGVVGVVGGRNEVPDGLVRLCRQASRAGFLIVTCGGGPCVEAAHLGAYMAPYEDDFLAVAEGLLAAEDRQAPGSRLKQAYLVRERFPLEEPARAASVSITTWRDDGDFPCFFATHHAKTFDHLPVAEGLWEVAKHGLIATALDPASASVFVQAATQGPLGRKPSKGADMQIMEIGGGDPLIPRKHPPDDDYQGPPAPPLVLFGAAQDPLTDAAWNLAGSIASARRVAGRLLRTNDPAEAIAFLESYHRAPR